MPTGGRQDVRFFEGARNVLITDSRFDIEATQPVRFKGWKEVIAPGAFHNSGERFDPPKCHPRTRKAILEKILSWVRGEIDPEAFIFWLNGSVGVGKSAIGQTIAEICEENGLLLASFFFGRSDPTRNNAEFLITTLAYQIGLSVSQARHRIEQVFAHDPVVHTRSLETQMKKLVIEPLRQAVADQINTPPLIIVDGLDECIDRSMQCKILDIIYQAGHCFRASGIHLVFLVGSRPEQEISLKLESFPMRGVTTHHILGDSNDADDDICHFLEDEFEEIKKTHPLKDSIPLSWPSLYDINSLVWRASGQFLYAHIVIDYTCNIRHHPIDRLQEIISLPAGKTNNLFADLDTLYTHIFSSLKNVDSALKIIGFKLADPFDKDIDSGLSRILHDVLTLSFDDVKLILGDLSSVIKVIHKPESSPHIWKMNLQHASLGEFLTDQHRSKQHFVDVQPIIAEWVSWILQNNLVHGDRMFWGLLGALEKLESCKSKVLHDALQDVHLGLLLSKPFVQSPTLCPALYKVILQIQTMCQ
ncbi:hypothetical protein NLJ89_g11198 [Agrocybe chaxingu]|uniref:Nephrocystin 3-like N-terminal domain-containing protein n=1 Tax=Agrocybe chaxingu TaxID=84603 RepID=A0A9W8JX83_9AGAR|nr:hypothetical protein NLJ89_g11198 [Agrocybe chaxingu]